jgi:hypothetical protein
MLEKKELTRVHENYLKPFGGHPSAPGASLQGSTSSRSYHFPSVHSRDQASTHGLCGTPTMYPSHCPIKGNAFQNHCFP